MFGKALLNGALSCGHARLQKIPDRWAYWVLCKYSPALANKVQRVACTARGEGAHEVEKDKNARGGNDRGLQVLVHVEAPVSLQPLSLLAKLLQLLADVCLVRLCRLTCTSVL